MKIKNYPLNFSTWDKREENVAKKVISSGYCTSGKLVKEFEDRFKGYFGSKYAVFCNSGSSANLLAVASLFFREKDPLKPGDEVIVPAVSWSTTYFPLSQYGLKLKFVDVDLDTFNINIREVESAIGHNTKAIVAVNLLGNPCKLTALKKICRKHELTLIEDNCEGMGAKHNDKYCGTFGVVGTFSTFFSHHISTVEGGIVVTDNEELCQIMLCLRSHGWSRNLPPKNHICKKSNNEFEELFKFYLPGYNLRSNEIFAAIGIEQLKKLPRFIDRRIKNYNYLKNKIKDFKLQKITDNSVSSWFGFGFLCDNRSAIVKKLKENSIECRPIVAGNFTNNPALKFMDYSIHGELKSAQYIDENGFYIGNSHLNMSKYIDHFIKNGGRH